MNFFLYFISLTFIYSFPTKSDSLEANLEAQLKTPSNSPNSQNLANHNFDERSGSPLSKEDRALALKLLGESSSNSPAVQALSDAHLQNKPLSPPSKEDWEHVVELLKSESGAPTSPQNLPQEQTLKRSFQLRQRQNKLAEELEKLNAELKMPPGQTLERYFQLRQRQYKLAEEVEKLNAEFLSLPSAALINPGLSTTFSQKLLRSQIRERLFQLHQSQIQIAEIFEKLNSEFLSHSSTTLINPFGLSAAVPQNLVLGQTFERLLQLRKIETQISEELGKLHADSFRLLSSAGPMNPSLSRAEANPLHRIHQEIVPGNPHLEISPLNFRNSPINSGSSHEQAMKNVLNNHQDQEPLGFNSISQTLQSSNHPTGGQNRRMFKDSSMSISKAISSDSSVGEEAAAKIFSKLPRLLK